MTAPGSTECIPAGRVHPVVKLPHKRGRPRLRRREIEDTRNSGGYRRWSSTCRPNQNRKSILKSDMRDLVGAMQKSTGQQPPDLAVHYLVDVEQQRIGERLSEDRFAASSSVICRTKKTTLMTMSHEADATPLGNRAEETGGLVIPARSQIPTTSPVAGRNRSTSRPAESSAGGSGHLRCTQTLTVHAKTAREAVHLVTRSGRAGPTSAAIGKVKGALRQLLLVPTRMTDLSAYRLSALRGRRPAGRACTASRRAEGSSTGPRRRPAQPGRSAFSTSFAVTALAGLYRSAEISATHQACPPCVSRKSPGRK